MDRRQAKPISYPEPLWRLALPRAVEAYLLGSVAVDTGGTQQNIPASGPLVSFFAPHSGWIESMVIDRCFRQVGRPWPAWLTKKDNLALPPILRGTRVICMDRDNPEPSLVRGIYALLTHPQGALATSIEGTRFGNPDDPQDLLGLAPFKTGPVRFATKARVPLLPVVILGSAKVAARLEEEWPAQGTLHVLHQIRMMRALPLPLTVRFLLPYKEHLDHAGHLRGTRLREWAATHTARLRQLLVDHISQLDPEYPLGAQDRP